MIGMHQVVLTCSLVGPSSVSAWLQYWLMLPASSSAEKAVASASCSGALFVAAILNTLSSRTNLQRQVGDERDVLQKEVCYHF
jgi:hypothetical protein